MSQRSWFVVLLALALTPLVGMGLALLGARTAPDVMAQGSGPIIRTSNMLNTNANNVAGLPLDTSQSATAVIQVTGGNGTVLIEGSQDNNRWTAIPCYPPGNATVAANAVVVSNSVMLRCSTAGIALLRARSIVWNTGNLIAIGLSTSLSAFGANGF